MGEQFAVLIFFADGRPHYVCRFVSAQEACRAFEHCIHNVETRFGIPMRVVITDRHDCILREWQFRNFQTRKHAPERPRRRRRMALLRARNR
jgi:hypothetical protein